VRFISEHKGVFGIEPICRVLSQHGCPIAPSTYYDAAGRPPCARAVRDEQLKAAITRVHADNYGVYGARKVWLALNREGIAVARCTVERLMGELGPAGQAEADHGGGPGRSPPRRPGQAPVQPARAGPAVGGRLHLFGSARDYVQPGGVSAVSALRRLGPTRPASRGGCT